MATTNKKPTTKKQVTKKTEKDVVKKAQPEAVEKKSIIETLEATSNYRLIAPYWNCITTILLDHVVNQTAWKEDVIKLIVDTKIPTDIVDTTMTFDDNYDEQLYVRWTSRMIQKSDIVILNVDGKDYPKCVSDLVANLDNDLIKSRYVIIRTNIDELPGDAVKEIMGLGNKYDNVLFAFNDKTFLQYLTTMARNIL